MNERLGLSGQNVAVWETFLSWTFNCEERFRAECFKIVGRGFDVLNSESCFGCFRFKDVSVKSVSIIKEG